MNLIKRMLGLQDDTQEKALHRKTLERALMRQKEAGLKTEATIVDFLARSATMKEQ